MPRPSEDADGRPVAEFMSLPAAGAGASGRRRLDSWKEIAAHLGRTVRTVQRWERDEGLPVHRHIHNKLSSIYAYADELDQWWAQRPTVIPADEPTAERDADLRPDAALRPAGVDGLVVLPAGGGHAGARLAAGALVTAIVVGTSAVMWWESRPQEPAARVDAATPDPDALYRRGRTAWQQRTPRGFEQARAAFETALAIDPTHGPSYAGLADTYSLLEAFGLMPAAEALPKARAAAERALQLVPDLGEAHASLSFVLWELHDPAGAMAEIERAIALDPSYATAHHWYGLYLQQFLRREDAIAEVRRAVELDPDQPVFWTELASVLKFAQRFDEAAVVLEDASRRHPGFPDIYIQLSDLAAERGNDSEAVGLLRRAVALGDNRPRVVSKLGCLEAATGNPAGVTEALHLLRTMEASGQHVPDDAFAVLHASSGNLDEVFSRIRRGIEQRQEWVGTLFNPPGCWGPARQDPRWASLRLELEQATWLPIGSRMPPREAQAPARPPRTAGGGS